MQNCPLLASAKTPEAGGTLVSIKVGAAESDISADAVRYTAMTLLPCTVDSIHLPENSTSLLGSDGALAPNTAWAALTLASDSRQCTALACAHL